MAKLTGATFLFAKLDCRDRNAAFLLTLRDSGVRFHVCGMPEANDLTVSIAEQAGCDQELLELELGGPGFDGAELDAFLKHGAPDPREEATPEVPEVPVSRPGDLWVLGKA
ncbi:hypothetical protein [Silicimonas algicola]|uniref:Uncharacterized protein n=1 Tax=Silicimonas algicola TaxID=1826607 RepID=A0A316G342_9RHOB|nr:hypothetical protein C8D95_10729 [Silicimonas algicola]